MYVTYWTNDIEKATKLVKVLQNLVSGISIEIDKYATNKKCMIHVYEAYTEEIETIFKMCNIKYE